MAAEEPPNATPLVGTPPPPTAGKESDVRSSRCPGPALETWQIHPIPTKPNKSQVVDLFSREPPKLKLTPSKKAKLFEPIMVIALHQNGILLRVEIPGLSTFQYRGKVANLKKDIDKDKDNTFSDEFKEWFTRTDDAKNDFFSKKSSKEGEKVPTERDAYLRDMTSFYGYELSEAEKLWDILVPYAHNPTKSNASGGPGNWVCFGKKKANEIARDKPDETETSEFVQFKHLLALIYPDKEIEFAYLDRDRL